LHDTAFYQVLLSVACERNMPYRDRGKQNGSTIVLSITPELACSAIHLGPHSRRQYIHFTQRQDFETTIRQHIEAFKHDHEAQMQSLRERYIEIASDFRIDASSLRVV